MDTGTQATGASFYFSFKGYVAEAPVNLGGKLRCGKQGGEVDQTSRPSGGVLDGGSTRGSVVYKEIGIHEAGENKCRSCLEGVGGEDVSPNWSQLRMGNGEENGGSGQEEEFALSVVQRYFSRVWKYKSYMSNDKKCGDITNQEVPKPRDLTFRCLLELPRVAEALAYGLSLVQDARLSSTRCQFSPFCHEHEENTSTYIGDKESCNSTNCTVTSCRSAICTKPLIDTTNTYSPVIVECWQKARLPNSG